MLKVNRVNRLWFGEQCLYNKILKIKIKISMTKTNLYLTLSVSLRDDGAVCPSENTTTAVADISIGPAEADDADVVGIADGEQVASSQNSDVFSPALHMSKMIQFNPAEETQLRSSSSTPVTPASSQCFKVFWILFHSVFCVGKGLVFSQLWHKILLF